MLSKALFLDRDGVINVDYGYVCHQDNFDFVDGIFDLVRTANQKGYKVIVVTNQSGIARAMYSESDFLSLTKWMVEVFKDQGAIIHDVYFCPHHPTAGDTNLTTSCKCRKPNTGLFEQAAFDHQLDLSTSCMVGDKVSDMEASTKLGFCSNFLLQTIDHREAAIKSKHNVTARSVVNGVKVSIVNDLYKVIQKI